jgi:phage tail-like protein
MPDRTAPYPSYNYTVDLKSGRNPEKPLGGFSEVSGPKTELHVSEYRDGNDPSPFVRKHPGVHTTGPCTLKRGVVNTSDIGEWVTAARTTGIEAQRDVTITLRDEANKPVWVCKLYNVIPKGYTGPALNGKGTGDLAIEELVLEAETFEITQAS